MKENTNDKYMGKYLHENYLKNRKMISLGASEVARM